MLHAECNALGERGNASLSSRSLGRAGTKRSSRALVTRRRRTSRNGHAGLAQKTPANVCATQRVVCRNSPPSRARCLGLRRSVLRYSDLPSSGRSCRITAQGEDELSAMPNRVGSFVGSERELGPDSRQGRCDTHSDRSKSGQVIRMARCAVAYRWRSFSSSAGLRPAWRGCTRAHQRRAGKLPRRTVVPHRESQGLSRSRTVRR